MTSPAHSPVRNPDATDRSSTGIGSSPLIPVDGDFLDDVVGCSMLPEPADRFAVDGATETTTDVGTAIRFNDPHSLIALGEGSPVLSAHAIRPRFPRAHEVG